MVCCKPGNTVSIPSGCTHNNTFLAIRCHRGVTLVELMLCLGMLSVVIAFAAPSMNALLERQRTIAATHSLISHLASARLSAVTHKYPVVLCPATENLQCTEHTNWSKNYLAFLDVDGNGKQRPNHPEDILVVHQNPLSGTMQLHSTVGRSQVRYLPDGRSPGSNVTFSICNSRGKLLSQVIINNAGRARSTRPKQVTACPN